MRIADQLYFAPRIKFSDLDLKEGKELPNQLHERIDGFFLKPTHELLKKRHAFAAGVIIVTCIDALSRFEYSADQSTDDRFPRWCKENLPSFKEGYSRRFYTDFRNGLVHEGRVKRGGEFTLKVDQAVVASEEMLSVNPGLLIDEVSTAFEKYIENLSEGTEGINNLKKLIESDFKHELSQ